MPMIVVQPAMTPAMIAESPTAPAPKTASVLPAGARSASSTPPAPVWMPHPKGAAISNGIESGNLTRLRSPATACVAKLDCPKKCAWMISPLRDSALVPSERVEAKLCAQKPWQ